ncbi:MAG: ABC transporter permease [Candidatus Hodarchaeota archaeon]
MGLKYYLVKRLALLPVLVILITSVLFFIARAAPGDPVRIFYGMRSDVPYSEAELAPIRAKLGLDQPIHIQYFKWLTTILQGDLGYSWLRVAPVAKVITPKLINTFILEIPAIILSLAIAIPAGVISAVKQYTKTDYAVMTGALLLWSMPWFWVGLMLIYVFAVYFGLFPTFGMYTYGQEGNLVNLLYHMVLPVITAGATGAGLLTRLTRSSMLEVLRQDYITAARSKGLKERVVIYKHALKNALIPVVTALSQFVSLLVGGAAVIEVVFAWPGIGRLVIEAAAERDYPVILGVNVVVAIAVLAAFIITDLVYTYLDPKIKL